MDMHRYVLSSARRHCVIGTSSLRYGLVQICFNSLVRVSISCHCMVVHCSTFAQQDRGVARHSADLLPSPAHCFAS